MISIDLANKVLELKQDGYSSSYISMITGVPATTVKRVIRGEHKGYSEKLGARQVQEFIDTGFRPI